MSLINDALKRATNFRKKENVPTPEGMLPLLVVNHDDSGKNRGKVVILGAVLVAVLGYFAWNQFGGGKVEVITKVQASKETNKLAKAAGITASASPVGAATNNNPIARAAKIAEGIRVANAEGAGTAEELNASNASDGSSDQKAGVVSKSNEPQVASSEPPIASATTISIPASQGDNSSPSSFASATTTAADGDFPSVQVQAIYFRIRNPMAVVNGKTMREGEEIEGVKIAQIAHNEVRMEYQGALKTVSLR